jgi:hypothetical protein
LDDDSCNVQIELVGRVSPSCYEVNSDSTGIRARQRRWEGIIVDLATAVSCYSCCSVRTHKLIALITYLANGG